MGNILLDILYIILTGCGVAVASYIVRFINSKIDELQSNIELNENEKLMRYIDNAQQAIANVVLSVSQTYVDNLKASGGFTKEAQAEAKQKAIDMAKGMISEESKNAIIIVYNDLDKYLDSTIESLVKQNKAE